MGDRVIFDVFVCDPVRVNLSVFQAFVGGLTAGEAANRPQHSRAEGPNCFPRHVSHQYHLFRLLAEKLERPAMLRLQQTLQVPQDVLPHVIEIYYSFDDALARELVGKRLTLKERRDIDDVSAHTGIPIASCLRQFDNIRRVYKAILAEPLKSAQDLVAAQFCLSPTLTSRYVRLAFLLENKPNLGGKRMQLLRYSAMEHIAQFLLGYWASPNGVALEIGNKFVGDVKAKLGKDSQTSYCKAVLGRLAGSLSSSALEGLGSRIRVILKSLLLMGAELSDWKEFRDLFEDLVEKVVDPCLEAGLVKKDIGAFFDALVSEFNGDWFSAKRRAEVVANWSRFLLGLKECAVFLTDFAASAGASSDK
eukprot:m51a1_g3343 hypothetical protein (363) ;mRNA; r:399781-401294